MKKIWLDTDIGSDIDDTLCLTYLLCEKECSLEGISTVSGEAEKRAELCSAVVRHLGKDVPIYSGADRPLVIETVQKEAPQYKKIDAFAHQTGFVPNAAVFAMREAIRRQPHEITLLAIGPLTNLALLFSIDPEIPSLLKELVIMGGHFLHPVGEENALRQEWNIFCDPHAADIVARADVEKVFWVGLDVTTQVVFDRKEAIHSLNSAALEPALAFSEEWFRHIDVMIFHDPLAAAVIFDPQLCTFSQGKVEVVYQEGKTCARTLFTPTKHGRHWIADKVDPVRFFQRYLEVTGCRTDDGERIS